MDSASDSSVCAAGAWVRGCGYPVLGSSSIWRRNSPGGDTGEGASLAILHSSLREVEQVAINGHKVGVTPSQGSREPDQVLIVRVGFHGASDYVLGRVPYDFGFVVQPAHVLGRLVVGEVPAKLLPCQDRLQLVEQARRDDEVELACNPAPQDLPRCALLGDGRADQGARVEYSVGYGDSLRSRLIACSSSFARLIASSSESGSTLSSLRRRSKPSRNPPRLLECLGARTR